MTIVRERVSGGRRHLIALFAAAALVGGIAPGVTTAASPVGADPQTDVSAAMRDAPERYVVLTVHNPVLPAPVRAASTPRGYDGARAYRVGAAARRVAAAIARDHHLTPAAEWPIEVLGVHCLVFRLADGADRDTELSALARDRRVEAVQPLAEFATLASGRDDPYRTLQSNLDALDIAAAQSVTRGRGVRVAIVDTAVDATHPDLGGTRLEVRDVVGVAPVVAELHGTQVAGLIGAMPGNGIGIAGIAPDAELLALRACWSRAAASASVCNSFTLARALAVAIDARADIVNLSIGGPPDPLLGRLVRAARDRGAIVVGAVPPDDSADAFPARVPGVIAVRASGAGRGGADDVAAPGVDVLTLAPGGGYDFASGSSMSAAEVSGVIALLLGARPHLRSADVLAALQASALQPTGTAAALAPVNACRALVAIGAKTSCPSAPRVADSSGK